jgi:hypothetical protein
MTSGGVDDIRSCKSQPHSSKNKTAHTNFAIIQNLQIPPKPSTGLHFTQQPLAFLVYYL